MTKEEFEKFWKTTYPSTIPISHHLRHRYVDRWFRIHSLPESKRYADSDDEWNILLARQNEIITDLLGSDSICFLLTRDYGDGSPSCIHITEGILSLKSISFRRLDDIDLYEFSSDDYDKGSTYRPAFTEMVWRANEYSELLVEMANDNIRAFLVSADKNAIVDPYDGGIDFILKDSESRDFYKQKYKEWLSPRADGY